MGRHSAYRDMRCYENIQKAMYWGTGEYRIPELMPVTEINVENWISFNYFNSCKAPETTNLHSKKK